MLASTVFERDRNTSISQDAHLWCWSWTQWIFSQLYYDVSKLPVVHVSLMKPKDAFPLRRRESAIGSRNFLLPRSLWDVFTVCMTPISSTRHFIYFWLLTLYVYAWFQCSSIISVKEIQKKISISMSLARTRIYGDIVTFFLARIFNAFPFSLWLWNISPFFARRWCCFSSFLRPPSSTDGWHLIESVCEVRFPSCLALYIMKFVSSTRATFI